jgi:RimJ/RimL family protein N-acetyltransferase
VADVTPMPLELETERLTLQLWQESDASWYRDLVGERGVDRPTPEAAQAKTLELREKAFDIGIALLTIRRKDEGDHIGYCGLIVGRATLDEPEIAYELFRRAHGRGYATEAASAVLDAAIGTGRQRLWSTVRAWNTPSLRVLEKLGFTRHHSTWDDRGEVIWNVRDLP